MRWLALIICYALLADGKFSLRSKKVKSPAAAVSTGRDIEGILKLQNYVASSAKDKSQSKGLKKLFNKTQNSIGKAGRSLISKVTKLSGKRSAVKKSKEKQVGK